MMACIGRNLSPLFKLTKYKIVAFDEVYILFYFNIICTDGWSFFLNKGAVRNVFNNQYAFVFMELKHRENIVYISHGTSRKISSLYSFSTRYVFNPLSPELNPICYLLALLAHHFLHVSRIRVKSLTLRLLMSYVYGTPILDVSRSHTTTQHSR
jgi:hypothetical protein